MNFIEYLNDENKKHRDDGPAYFWYDFNGILKMEEYFLYGINLTKKG